MSDTQAELSRYEGQFVIREGGGMVLLFEARDGLLTVKATGMGRGRLKPDGEHRFTGVNFDRTFQFEMPDEGPPLHLIVSNAAGEHPPLAADRLEPWKADGEAPSDAVDLGWIFLCLRTRDWGACRAFYEKLGFAAVGKGWAMRHGWSTLLFFDFEVMPLNFRGPNLRELASELARRGHDPLTHVGGDARTISMLPPNGSGSFTIRDPDGNGAFFNTHPPELEPYARWKADKGYNEEHERFGQPTPRTLPLGQLLLCYDVEDLAASMRFYETMGWQLIDRSDSQATFTAIPPHATTEDVPEHVQLRLRQADRPEVAVAFICEDPVAAAAAIRKRGIDIVDTARGPAFVDPDGRSVTLLSG